MLASCHQRGARPLPTPSARPYARRMNTEPSFDEPDTSPDPSRQTPTTTLDFGPYAGRDVAFVAVADPGYLLELVREGVGSPGGTSRARSATGTLDVASADPGPAAPCGARVEGAIPAESAATTWTRSRPSSSRWSRRRTRGR